MRTATMVFMAIVMFVVVTASAYGQGYDPRDWEYNGGGSRHGGGFNGFFHGAYGGGRYYNDRSNIAWDQVIIEGMRIGAAIYQSRVQSQQVPMMVAAPAGQPIAVPAPVPMPMQAPAPMAQQPQAVVNQSQTVVISPQMPAPMPAPQPIMTPPPVPQPVQVAPMPVPAPQPGVVTLLLPPGTKITKQEGDEVKGQLPNGKKFKLEGIKVSDVNVQVINW